MDADLAQVAEIAWQDDLRVSKAEGACELVLGTRAEDLLHLALHQVLRISPARARELNAKARSVRVPTPEFATSSEDPPRTFRLVLAQRAGLCTSSVLDLSAALCGAPPLQISKLSSSLSHEIRNPLSSVKLAVQTLARNVSLSDRDKRRLSIANREIRTMERMLWLLGEYGRDSWPVLEAVALRAIVQEAASLVEPELSERGIRVVVEEEADLPRIRGDAGRLRPVLAQILLNIAQGLPEGSGLPIRLAKDPLGCRLFFEDRSAALPPEERQTVFEPFGSRLARGAGLSLAALSRVMIGLGGTVRAEGGEEPPTHFTLCFPA